MRVAPLFRDAYERLERDIRSPRGEEPPHVHDHKIFGADPVSRARALVLVGRRPPEPFPVKGPEPAAMQSFGRHAESRLQVTGGQG